MSEGPFGRRSDTPEVREPETRPRPPAPPPPRPRRYSNSTWIVGVAIFLILAYITLNTIRTRGQGARGVSVGSVLPAFAAPLATSSVPEDTDANVFEEETGGVPAACDVRRADVVNVCEMRKRGPVVLVFTVTKSERCEDQVDVVERVRSRFPEVQFAAVAIKGEREDVRRLIRERGWGLPVAYDHDGAVSNLYGVAICPTITFAGRGGKVAGTALGFIGEAEIVRRIEAMS